MKLEPVAWHVKDKTDFFTMWKPIARQWILDGFDVVEMFPAIPEGYVVVPKEPDEAMTVAGLTKMADGGSLAEIYKVMIAAGEQ